MPRTATAKKRNPESPGADRQRRYLERQIRGEALAKVPVPESYRELMIADGLLDEWCRDDRDAIADAVRAILDAWNLAKATEFTEFNEENEPEIALPVTRHARDSET